MTKETLIVLCASLCFSFTLPRQAEAQSRKRALTQEIRTAKQGLTVADTLKGGGSRALLADHVEVKKVISAKKQQREEQEKKLQEQEALEMPAVDLYGENSWEGTVNPFANSEVSIPERYEIDLGEFVMPLQRKQVTSHFGYRSRFGRMHHGTDLALSIGDEVRSAFSGRVRVVSYEGGGYGKYIVIRHANGLETVYGHLSRQLVKEGDIVRAGDVIGLGGNTGRSTGPHLHFEMRFMGIALNPAELIDFAEGAPRTDSYTFVRGRAGKSSRMYASTASNKAKPKSTKSKNIATHRIKSGDTLSSIAAKHGTTVAKLKKANNLSSDKLREGKVLRLPS